MLSKRALLLLPTLCALCTMGNAQELMIRPDFSNINESIEVTDSLTVWTVSLVDEGELDIGFLSLHETALLLMEFEENATFVEPAVLEIDCGEPLNITIEQSGRSSVLFEPFQQDSFHVYYTDENIFHLAPSGRLHVVVNRTEKVVYLKLSPLPDERFDVVPFRLRWWGFTSAMFISLQKSRILVEVPEESLCPTAETDPPTPPPVIRKLPSADNTMSYVIFAASASLSFIVLLILFCVTSRIIAPRLMDRFGQPLERYKEFRRDSESATFLQPLLRPLRSAVVEDEVETQPKEAKRTVTDTVFDTHGANIDAAFALEAEYLEPEDYDVIMKRTPYEPLDERDVELTKPGAQRMPPPPRPPEDPKIQRWAFDDVWVDAPPEGASQEDIRPEHMEEGYADACRRLTFEQYKAKLGRVPPRLTYAEAEKLKHGDPAVVKKLREEGFEIIAIPLPHETNPLDMTIVNPTKPIEPKNPPATAVANPSVPAAHATAATQASAASAEEKKAANVNVSTAKEKKANGTNAATVVKKTPQTAPGATKVEAKTFTMDVALLTAKKTRTPSTPGAPGIPKAPDAKANSKPADTAAAKPVADKK